MSKTPACRSGKASTENIAGSPNVECSKNGDRVTVLLIDDPALGVRRLRVNRPEARNAIDADVRAALRAALTAASQETAVRSLLIGSANGIFCAGGDLPSMIGLSSETADARMRESHEIAATIATFPKPVVVAVERFAIGAGAGMALLADYLIMADDAVLGFPFLKIGLVPDWGTTATLPLRIGFARAARILRSSETVKSSEALELGIADEVLPADQVEPRSIEQACNLAALPAAAFRSLKARLNGTQIQTALDEERVAQVSALSGPEFAEGYAAFIEKRSARFADLVSR